MTNDIIPEPDLGRDTGGTSQRRGVYGDPWSQPVSPGAADLQRIIEVDRPVDSSIFGPNSKTYHIGYPELFEEQVSWPMTLGLWGLALLVGVIYGFYFL